MKNNIKEELEKFKEFKKTYQFNQKEIVEKSGRLYCDNMPILDENDKEIGECDNWINVGYKIKGAYSKTLSNLFPYEFNFKGKTLKSLESFFQGIKFKNIDMQNLVFNYSGLDANNIKIASDFDWKDECLIYFQGQAIKRDSQLYIDLVDELYISAIQNPLYRNILKKCDKYILHSIGGLATSDTVFTRYEFEYQLNCLKDFLKQ